MGEHILKIHISELKPGMFVHDLSSEWTDTPFKKRFMVTDAGMVRRIQEYGIQELYVDTIKGDAPRGNFVPEDVVSRQLDGTIEELVKDSSPTISVSYTEEIAQARHLHEMAKDKVSNLLQDARMGKSIEAEQMEPVVAGMADSILRNPSAMMSLGRIRVADQYTFEHSVSVGTFLIAFARAQQLDEATIHQIGMGALLHDIGKTQVPEEILNKPGKLTDEEFAAMKSHAQRGHDLLASSSGISAIAQEVVVQHHERFDGTGYPRGLKGDQISTYGQMAAVVDVYDAITSDRCYHKGQTPTQVLRKLLEWSKFHFNPAVVQQFIKCVGIYPPGSLVRLSNQYLAVVLETDEARTLHPTVRQIFDIENRRPVKPRVINLQNESHSELKVVNFEDPQKWNIPLEQIIPR
ncbi:HD-GYP domain-containing protein [Desulfurispira natronophila]|uniref:Putative nucleotidyltransferase with HDIG domain n=1 Tax=Desulfurispira natronophila TaxID=682562 RepID=A0A7W7Y3C5_9BACT|nr:HD-GYP domain-containing protein [Desulfurispira natronophila]MBB5021335.1 putative nucleotidyltransferase with HDIG domain [Desulfurispira natronophila]